jgi:hypothetical protein
MNDIHDAFTPPLWPKWKTDHPDALLGKREDWGKYPAGQQRRWWAGVDFTRSDVRKRTVELIDEVAQNYDVDGIDLDWLRHPIHFKETLLGRPCTGEQVGLITDLVRDVRKVLETAGSKRGRPILMSTRVPMTVRQGLYMGTDVETWLKEGLIDFLTIGGGYVPFTMPTAEIASLGHRYDVPVTPCISASGLTRRKPYGPGGIYGTDAWLATASNAFAAGADGVSFFNLFPRPGAKDHNEQVRQVFTQAGDPATLAGKSKLFCIDNAAHMARCGYINHVVPWKDCLPKPIEPGKPLAMSLPVGDDVNRAKSATLRIQTDKPCEVACRINGQALSPSPSEELAKQIGMAWRTASVKPATVRKGQNRVEISAPKGAGESVAVVGVELLIRYV